MGDSCKNIWYHQRGLVICIITGLCNFNQCNQYFELMQRANFCNIQKVFPHQLTCSISGLTFWKLMSKEGYSLLRLAYFTIWTVYGTVPSLHWFVQGGGFENDVVRIFFPRICVMYALCGTAFLFYLSRMPERCLPG